MSKPKRGDVVLFDANGEKVFGMQQIDESECVGIITYVYDDDCVNLVIIDHYGSINPLHKVAYYNHGRRPVSPIKHCRPLLGPASAPEEDKPNRGKPGRKPKNLEPILGVMDRPITTNTDIDE